MYGLALTYALVKNPANLQDVYVRSALASSSLTTGSTTNGVVTAGGVGSSIGTSSSSSSGATTALPAITAVNGEAVPLSTFTHFESRSAPLSVNHQGQSTHLWAKPRRRSTVLKKSSTCR
jgi:hypothetical protein